MSEKEILQWANDPLSSAHSPEPADEEQTPHTFAAREDAVRDDEGPIWCDVCCYHRDHAIHSQDAAIKKAEAHE
jgi:hypothetical protein